MLGTGNSRIVISKTAPVNVLRGITPTAVSWDGQINYAYLDDGGVFTDDTVDANSAAANDVPLMPAVEAINDAFYFGDANIQFNQIKINIGTAGVGGTIAWEYYNGATWAALTTVDGTTGFTTSGTNYVTFTVPVDWATVAVNGATAYWVRARVTVANFATIPLATQIWLGAAPTSLTNLTDGNFSTSTGTGSVNRGAAGNFGTIVFDLGTTRTVLVGVRVGIWSAAGTVYVHSESSDDNITYRGSGATTGGAVAQVTNTTELVFDAITKVLTGRYIRFKFYVSAASATCNMNGYQAMAYDLGI